MPPLFLYIANYPVFCSSRPAGQKMLHNYTHYPIIARLPGSTREKPEDRAIFHCAVLRLLYIPSFRVSLFDITKDHFRTGG